MAAEPPEENTFRIVISTDNHLGYLEKDPVRGNDSFEAFEEVLKHALKINADLLLLGGDLFHDNKPSRQTLFRTMALLRKYCMGDGDIKIEIVSDQKINFPNTEVVNYQDPNYNVQLPVFSIHGNHDDPTREGGTTALAALDLLSVSNLVNYFGKSERVDNIEIHPILMEKGTTKIALYGLGSVRDERLNRMFAQKKVKFLEPVDGASDENGNSPWFNIFIIHQNRDNRGRGSKNCVPESFIPNFINLVLWGHEHECLISPEYSLKGDFFVTQPGSSVATSLVEGEAVPKHFGVLEIADKEFRITRIKFENVRPFIFHEVSLSDMELDPDDPNIQDKISAKLVDIVKDIILDAKEQMPNNKYKEILVRLRVEHSGFPVLNNQRFGRQFVGEVANPNDILLFFRRRKGKEDEEKDPAKRPMPGPLRPLPLDQTKVEDFVAEKLRTSASKLMALPVNKLGLALESYIKGDAGAIGEMVEREIETLQEILKKKKEVKQVSEIKEVVSSRSEQVEKEPRPTEERGRADQNRVNGDATETQLNNASAGRREVRREKEAEEEKEGREPDLDFDEDFRGGVRGRGPSPKGRTTQRASAKKAAKAIASYSEEEGGNDEEEEDETRKDRDDDEEEGNDLDFDDDDEEEDFRPAKRGRTAAAKPASKSRAKRAPTKKKVAAKRGGGRGKKVAAALPDSDVEEIEISDEDDVAPSLSSSTRGRRPKPRAKAAPKLTQSNLSSFLTTSQLDVRGEDGEEEIETQATGGRKRTLPAFMSRPQKSQRTGGGVSLTGSQLMKSWAKGKGR